MPDGQICRQRDGQEWEIPLDYHGRHFHFARNKHDDPSYCELSDKVTVAADVVDEAAHDGPRILWKAGESLILTEDERKMLEEIEFEHECEERIEMHAEQQWRK